MLRCFLDRTMRFGTNDMEYGEHVKLLPIS